MERFLNIEQKKHSPDAIRAVLFRENKERIKVNEKMQLLATVDIVLFKHEKIFNKVLQKYEVFGGFCVRTGGLSGAGGEAGETVKPACPPCAAGSCANCTSGTELF